MTGTLEKKIQILGTRSKGNVYYGPNTKNKYLSETKKIFKSNIIYNFILQFIFFFKRKVYSLNINSRLYEISNTIRY